MYQRRELLDGLSQTIFSSNMVLETFMDRYSPNKNSYRNQSSRHFQFLRQINVESMVSGNDKGPSNPRIYSGISVYMMWTRLENEAELEFLNTIDLLISVLIESKVKTIWILKRFQNQMECHCSVLDSVRSQFWSGSKPNWSFTWNHSLPEAFSKAKSSRGLLKLSSWSFWTHFTVNIVDGGARDSPIFSFWPLATRHKDTFSYDFITCTICYVMWKF